MSILNVAMYYLMLFQTALYVLQSLLFLIKAFNPVQKVAIAMPHVSRSS